MNYTLCCPNCGAHFGDGTEFVLVENYRGERTGLIEGWDKDGAIIPSMIDAMILSVNETRFIHCGKCGHEWGTKRRISEVWE